MFCPTCHDPNPAGAETCHVCDSRLPDRKRVYIGQQFVLLNGDADHPIAAGLDRGTPMTVSRPTIVSRHRHAVTFGDSQGREGPTAIARLQSPAYRFPLADLPRLDAPRVDLTAVVTERKVYDPDDEAHIFIIAPDHLEGEVELEVRLADQQIMREKVSLNAGGLALFCYADLEEGEYTVRVRRVMAQADPGEEAAQRASREEWAECQFSVAEFTLSPLIATLASHTYSEGKLSFQLRVQQLSVPYSGKTQVGLQCRACNDQVIRTQELQAQAGVATGEFDFGDHAGPFKLQITTPQGETALVDLPGSGAGERERIVISPLGRVAEASLLPGDDTQPVRGLHVGYGDVNAAPFRLESAVARNARFTAAQDYAGVQIVAHNPISGESTVHEWHQVARGDRLTTEVNPPFTMFTVAAATPERLYESWATVVRPLDLDATLVAPDRAAPGDSITVSLSAAASPRLPSTVYCLLLAYDARLEHESPLPKLGRRQYRSIRDASTVLGDGPAPDATEIAPPMDWLGATRSAPPPTGAAGIPVSRTAPVARLALGSILGLRDLVARSSVPTAEVVEIPTLLMPPSRENFPELAYLELFAFEGQAERVIPLGDQIGTWRCRAYLVGGLDLVELTADVQADKPLYAELDLPAIVAEGDEIEASVTYHSDSPSEMAITLPGGETIRGMVMGHGTERFKLTGPGEVSVQLSGASGQDWTTRSVKAPGVQTVTASRLELLQAGETIAGQRVVVYPGMDLVLTDTIEALLRYPFG